MGVPDTALPAILVPTTHKVKCLMSYIRVEKATVARRVPGNVDFKGAAQARTRAPVRAQVKYWPGVRPRDLRNISMKPVVLS